MLFLLQDLFIYPVPPLFSNYLGFHFCLILHMPSCSLVFVFSFYFVYLGSMQSAEYWKEALTFEVSLSKESLTHKSSKLKYFRI